MTDSLLTRLAQAKMGSRELDGDIALAINAVPSEFTRRGAKAAAAEGLFFSVDGYSPEQHWQKWEAPHYTTSIDAAMTLAPDHPLWESIRFERHREGVGCFLDGADAFAATPALALCIVALRAREEEGKR